MAAAASATESALSAAEASVVAVKAMNDNPPDGLPAAALPLNTGVALHFGEVFFGNVGAPAWLDFNVIGRAVNEASRVETLTKEVGRPCWSLAPSHRCWIGRWRRWARSH